MKLRHSTIKFHPQQKATSLSSGIIITSAVAAFAAFSLSLPPGIFHKQTFDLSLIPRAVAAQEATKTNPLAITSKELRGYLDQAREITDLVEVLRFAHEVFKFKGGKLGLKPSAEKFRKPKTPDELAEGKKGDCSDGTYAIVGFLVALEKKDIEVGAIFGHVKGASENITHIVPAAKVDGKLIIIDPFSSFGRTVEFDRQQFQKAEVVEGNYYRELGDYHKKQGNVQNAVEAYGKAFERNSKDEEARGQAINLLFREFNRVRQNLKPENHAAVDKAIKILDEILFFISESDEQRPALDSNLQTLKSWVQAR
ncbi:MAG: transglutaminase-like domain-containing protein [Candidatus Micrarchaeota archaeon]